MHKFLRSIGFSGYQKKKEIEELLKQLEEEASYCRQVQIDEDTVLCELRAETAPGMGIAMIGEKDEEGKFHREYYYPYLEGEDISSNADCSIQRHTEKESCSGLLDEYRVGISLIFYLDNLLEYRKRKKDQVSVKVEGTCLSALAASGKIILPVKKTAKQIAQARVANIDRNKLIEAAKNGDEDAIETLTIEDIDTYSQVSRRVMKEDLYSIIDSCFMPCGIECDQYSVIGEIMSMELLTNQYTGEEVYHLTIESSDVIFQVGIARQDLLGEPAVGRRFKGKIWMMGRAEFEQTHH